MPTVSEIKISFKLYSFEKKCFLTHLCRPVRSTFAVRETASLGIMGEPRVSPLNPSETIVLSGTYESMIIIR